MAVMTETDMTEEDEVTRWPEDDDPEALMGEDADEVAE